MGREARAIAEAGGRLDLLAAGEPLVLTLGEPEAGKWAAALLGPPPSLAALPEESVEV